MCPQDAHWVALNECDLTFFCDSQHGLRGI